MSTNRVLHNATDSSGNSIPCIGFNFGLTLKRDMFPCNEVIKAAERLNIPTDVFRENTKKNSFVKAVKKNIGKVLDKKGTVIHEIEKSNEKVVFSVDRIILTEEQRNMISSDTNSFEVINTNGARFETVTKLVYDCSSEKVLCDSEEILTEILKLLKVYEESYEKAQFSMQIRRILSKHGDIIPWVDSGHAYFVPAKHKDLMFNLFKLVNELDPEAKITRGEVPDLTFSKQTVAEGARGDILIETQFIIDKIYKLYSDDENNKLTTKIIQNIIVELSKSIRRAEEFRILTQRDMGIAAAKIEEAQNIVREFVLTGKITKPVKTEEQVVEEEVSAEIEELASLMVIDL